ncbi:hypothetical protein NL676_002456 [Syzygium grande]|nr:hypothetical protein NL676_002456 [Syzygium grande]
MRVLVMSEEDGGERKLAEKESNSEEEEEEEAVGELPPREVCEGVIVRTRNEDGPQDAEIGRLPAMELREQSRVDRCTSHEKLAHLLGFTTAWGAALWVTFIGVTIMFRNLPRHQFGNLQSKMFPAYYLMLAVCCAISVASFGYLHACMEVIIHNREVPARMMKQRHRVEEEDEIGRSKNRKAAKVNPKLAAANRKFGMYHGLSSLAS